MKVCQNCNQTNPPEAMFCRQCASPLGAGQQNQPPPPTPQYQQPPPIHQPQNFARPASGGSTSGRAMASAGLAVLSLFCCGFLSGLPAAVLGWLEIQAIKEGKSSPDGMMFAQIGLWGGIIGGIIGTILGFIGLLIFAGMNSNPYYY